MLKNLKNNKIIYITLVIVIIILGYFFWPRTFKVSNRDKISISIEKDIEDTGYYYVFNEQEINDFVKILKKSRFCHGVSRPDRMFAGKSIYVRVIGGLSPGITIYYDDDKTYVFANISDGIFLNVYYRISNKDDIKSYIENIVNTKKAEFEKVPISYNLQ
jgi:hypothetical protein